MRGEEIIILLVDNNRVFAEHLITLLSEEKEKKFSVIWKENGEDAVQELEKKSDVDLVLMEHFLPGQNGLQVAKSLLDSKNHVPIVILTANKDFDLAIEAMKLGVVEYLLKGELSTPVLSKTIDTVIEKRRQEEQRMAPEVTQHRLEAMRDIASQVLKEIAQPVKEMQEQMQQWNSSPNTEQYQKFLDIIKENVSRIAKKIEQLKTLNSDKTVKYIKGIRMIDLS